MIAARLALVAMVAVIVAMAAPGTARAEPEVTATGVQNDYPEALNFTLAAEASTEITDATLHYEMVGRGTSGVGKPDDFEPGSTIETGVRVRVNAVGAYIPVGTEFRYQWEITTAGGDTVRTEPDEFLYLPPDRDWQVVESGVMQIFYHGDRESLARDYLEAGEETYQEIAVELLQAELPVEPVKVILFADGEEMAPARQGRGGTFDEAVTTCGVKLTVDVVFVVPISCGTPDVTDTLRHEFAHIINEAAGEGPLGRLPAWIDEGTAVYAQSTPGSNFEGAFESAVSNDDLIPFSRMGTPSSDPGAVNLFYGQSYAMVRFLIEEGGEEEFARFFATMRDSQRFDRAIEEVYSMTMREFENAFREAHGLEPRQEPGDDSAAAAATDETGGVDTGMVLILGSATLFVLLAIFSYLLARYLHTRDDDTLAARGDARIPAANEDER